MRPRNLRLGTLHPGVSPPVRILRISACLLTVIAQAAHADGHTAGDPDRTASSGTVTPTTVAAASGPTFTPTKIDPDPPPRQTPPGAPAAAAAPSWDLDGLYFWLGPTGAASRIDAQWDSTFGADASVIYVREQAAIGAIGATLGASRWTVRGGGRIWLDGLMGTRMGRMVGASAGPILELSELSHPRVGGSVGLWAFVGVTPFVRAGIVSGLGNFVEIGVHIALPVIRRR